jgi:hypothetical protein
MGNRESKWQEAFDPHPTLSQRERVLLMLGFRVGFDL